jgi:hypothetical protein
MCSKKFLFHFKSIRYLSSFSQKKQYPLGVWLLPGRQREPREQIADSKCLQVKIISLGQLKIGNSSNNPLDLHRESNNYSLERSKDALILDPKLSTEFHVQDVNSRVRRTINDLKGKEEIKTNF